MTMISNTEYRTSTKIRQQQEQEQNQQHQSQQEQHQEQQQEAKHYYYYNYNPARARACAREATPSQRQYQPATMGDVTAAPDVELPPREVMEQIADAYRANISQQITRAAAGIIERALGHGMEPSTVILAIEETGMASRPSPYYLSAVLRNWAENGVVLSRSRSTVSTTDARPWWR